MGGYILEGARCFPPGSHAPVTRLFKEPSPIAKLFQPLGAGIALAARASFDRNDIHICFLHQKRARKRWEISCALVSQPHNSPSEAFEIFCIVSAAGFYLIILEGARCFTPGSLAPFTRLFQEPSPMAKLTQSLWVGRSPRHGLREKKVGNALRPFSFYQ